MFSEREARVALALFGIFFMGVASFATYKSSVEFPEYLPLGILFIFFGFVILLVSSIAKRRTVISYADALLNHEVTFFLYIAVSGIVRLFGKKKT